MLVITFLAIMLLATLAIIVLIRSTTETLIKHHHEQRASFFAAHPIQPGDIVFLGDSITDGAIWIELFPGLPVKTAVSMPIQPYLCWNGWDPSR